MWDLTGFGEGLRNTISLRGRAGGQGFLHWSANFDEVQDFEGQIRNLAGGSGLMANADFNAGTRSQPLGDPKAGLSADLDALAAYVASLNTFSPSPLRNADGTLTAAAIAGTHGVPSPRTARAATAARPSRRARATTRRTSARSTPTAADRLGGPLTGIDVPTLRDVWATAPYLHRGSAATLGDAIRAHQGITCRTRSSRTSSPTCRRSAARKAPSALSTPNTGTGLAASYFNNTTLAGSPVLERIESVNFSWSASPGPGVNADNFSVRWTGFVEASATGNFQFQTRSNAGVRLWINGNLVIDNWTAHATMDDVTGDIAMTKNQRYSVKLEMYDTAARRLAKFYWMRPGQTTFAIAPATRLYAN